MKRTYLFPVLALVLMVMSCKKETSVEPPEITPPVVVTPKDNYLINTISIKFDGVGARDSVRFVYNSKNQVTDMFANEGHPATFLYSHESYFYDEAGKVIKVKSYAIPRLQTAPAFSGTDSMKWTSDYQFQAYQMSTEGAINNPPKIIRLNGNKQINYYNDPVSSYDEKYEYQGKDVSKRISTERQGKTLVTTYEYSDKTNPFYQLYIQHPFFYRVTFLISPYCSFSEHLAVKIIEDKYYTDLSYKFDAVTGLMMEQKKTVVFPNSPAQVTTSTFSYIKAQ